MASLITLVCRLQLYFASFAKQLNSRSAAKSKPGGVVAVSTAQLNTKRLSKLQYKHSHFRLRNEPGKKILCAKFYSRQKLYQHLRVNIIFITKV